MKASLTSKAGQEKSWPRKVQPGRAVVTVYRRKTPLGNFAYMVANYVDPDPEKPESEPKRRFDCYHEEAAALEAADRLARRLDARDYVGASMTKSQVIEYANAVTRLKPFNVTVDAATATAAECLKKVGDLSNLHAAVRFYMERSRPITKKPVPEVVAELIAIKKTRTKKGRAASDRYMGDLGSRLNRFARDCNKDCCNVTTADIQDWLDGLKLAPQGYKNFRAVLHTLFQFAAARNYVADNPVKAAEKVEGDNGNDIQVFTPVEIARLLDAARQHCPDFLPCLAIGAFAGVRSAEIVRLEWSDIHLAEKSIVVSASNAKTASRRIVPMRDNLAEWLRPYAGRQGKVWRASPILFYKRQESVAAATAVEADEAKGVKAQKPVKWKANALRHSYASYRFAQTGDAGRVAGECGNSAAVIHRHYRELVMPADAERWFNVKPEAPANVLQMPAAATL